MEIKGFVLTCSNCGSTKVTAEFSEGYMYSEDTGYPAAAHIECMNCKQTFYLNVEKLEEGKPQSIQP